ncbi:winged helix-turn-helix domain-containing protein [Paraburkholderia kururiensis]|uniref:Winged helix-turn-helix domain-containing protein n=1 Tax=Paraburkholderia kururiensis TaxID=984307 RepID=A0ABZ0WT13_9BURK|nr:winged helix-turn-helix domain-containing protein [Paraburkholderia kururiensis]WQD80543.1 winged helix-turn-helix domain-containing protein [Paraburkholderia kururiensis]
MKTIKIGQLEILLDRREVRVDGRKVRAGSRAFDILVLLIAAQGEVVAKDEIIRRVWPTTVVEKNNLEVHICALRRVFGRERDRIRTVPGRGYRLIMDGVLPGLPGPGVSKQGRPKQGASNAAVQRAAVQRPADALQPAHEQHAQPSFPESAQEPTSSDARPRPRQPLPARMPELIGRHEALAGIADALRTRRIVTLVGTGGIGKTRLAVELAHYLQHEFADGAVFVPLSAAHGWRSALDALAVAMGSRLSAGPAALAQLAGEWRNREALVVLDNCEQILDIAAAIAEALVAAGSGVRVLATSREALRVPDETVHHVPPLALPSAAGGTGEVLDTPAVQLFLMRAQADGAHFLLDETVVRLTADVCRRLDGIPLALELAASRAAVLGLGQLAANLDDRFSILTGGRRTALPRHQTLQATLDWSYRLLGRDEQKLLRWLGTLVGSFSFDAARAVGEYAGLTAIATLDALGGLAARSLLATEPEGAGYRYRLLETTRAYAQQQLDDEGERARAADAHASLVVTLLRELQTQWKQQPIEEWLVHFMRELGNVRAALDWTLEGAGDAVVGIELAAITVPWLYELSLVEECCDRARAALRCLARTEGATLPVDTETHIRLVGGLAAAAVYTDGPLEETREAWSRVLDHALKTGDTGHALRARWGVWNWHQYGGRAREALVLARRFGEQARETGEAIHGVLAARVEGIAEHYAGNQPRARTLLEQMIEQYDAPLARWHTTGSRVDHSTAARATLARVRWAQGEQHEACELAARSFHAALRADYEIVTCYVLVEAAVPLALLNADNAAARQGIDVLQRLSTRFGLTIWSTCCACYDAWLATLTQPGPEATARLAVAIAALRATNFLAPLPMLSGQLARALLHEARDGEALAVIGEARRHCERSGARWYDEALGRIDDEILGAPYGGSAARHTFTSMTVDLARDVMAAPEIRAAMGALRLPPGQPTKTARENP